MKKLVVDVEVTVQRHDGRIDGSPYNPANRLVSVGYASLDGDKVGPVSYHFFHHNDLEVDPYSLEQSRRALQDALDNATILVGHNIKFDSQWLMACGFQLPRAYHDTMLDEYLLARGLKHPLNLEACAERRGVSAKRKDLIDGYWSQGIGYEAMPMAAVAEYGTADVQATGELHLAHEGLFAQPENVGMQVIREQFHIFAHAITHMEQAGIAIDIDALDSVESAYKAEREELQAKLRELTYALMGDTPVNLASGEQLSRVVYSRRVLDKDKWKSIFHLGLDARGKQLYRPKMTGAEFVGHIKANTERVYKTRAVQCPECEGRGYIQETKKDGSFRKNVTQCKTCRIKEDGKIKGTGIVYEKTDAIAGLKMVPRGVLDISVGGFVTNKAALMPMIAEARIKQDHTAVEFLSSILRLNAIETYLTSFCTGIRRGLRKVGDTYILHPQFNLHVTSTQRLSSSDPNFQNQPRGSTFPIRRTVVSRFPGGKILEGDYSGLEFRTAGHLARDKQILDDVIAGKDVHKQTASVIFQKAPEEVTKDERQFAKPYTFAPLYGGKGAGEPPHIQAYFNQFMEIYKGVARWHGELQNEAIANRMITTPDGKQFAFPFVTRTMNGGATQATQIKNYPVQYFATGLLVPLAFIRLHQAIEVGGYQSKLVLTVHDSLVIDVYPGEEDDMVDVMKKAMLGVVGALEKEYGITMYVPLAIEMKMGSNWLDTTVIGEAKTEVEVEYEEYTNDLDDMDFVRSMYA